MAKKNKGFCQEVMEEVAYAQGGYCKLCGDAICDYHHKLHNTTPNRKLFPLFIHSVFNCVGLCRRDHEQNSWKFNLSLPEAAVYEEALRRLKDGNKDKG